MTKDLLIETWFFVTGHNLGVKRLMNDWLVSRRRYISIKGPDSGDAVEVAEVMKEDTPEINRCHGLLIITTPPHRATTWFSLSFSQQIVKCSFQFIRFLYSPDSRAIIKVFFIVWTNWRGLC